MNADLQDTSPSKPLDDSNAVQLSAAAKLFGDEVHEMEVDSGIDIPLFEHFLMIGVTLEVISFCQEVFVVSVICDMLFGS